MRAPQMEEITSQPITWVLLEPIITPASGCKPHSLAPLVFLPLAPPRMAGPCSSPDPHNSDPQAWKVTFYPADHKALWPLHLSCSLVLAPFCLLSFKTTLVFLPIPGRWKTRYTAKLEQRAMVPCISSCRGPGPAPPLLPSRPHSSH